MTDIPPQNGGVRRLRIIISGLSAFLGAILLLADFFGFLVRPVPVPIYGGLVIVAIYGPEASARQFDRFFEWLIRRGRNGDNDR